jgi:DNA-binding NarL/FixJ family response regulator
MKIAKEQVLAAIRSKGGDPKDYPAEKIAEYVSLVLQKKPEIREEAARRIASSREMASDLLPDFFDEAA